MPPGRHAAGTGANAHQDQLGVDVGLTDGHGLLRDLDALVFAEGLAQLFDVVTAFLVVLFAQDRDDAAGVVHRDRMSGDFLKFFGQRRVQPRGDEAPLRVLGQVQEFRLAPDQPYVGPRRLIGIGRRVQHGHFPALAGKPVCQRGARYAPAYDDDILFCRAHGRMPPADPLRASNATAAPRRPPSCGRQAPSW